MKKIHYSLFIVHCSFSLLVGFSTTMYGQNKLPDSLMLMFHQQLAIFPQEKIHIHTDKPYYISGEQIWFRAYITDASSHAPASASRYIYVELIDPLDRVVTRIKIQQDKGAWYGNLLIPEDAPEGDYMMRAYTAYMQNIDEQYFWHKTIRIGDPQSRAFHAEANFSFTPGGSGRVNATLHFSNLNASGSSVPFVPPYARISINNGDPMEIKVGSDGAAAFHFDLPVSSRERTLLIEAETSRNPFRKFIYIPTPDDDFDVTFYPEGGSLMQGVSCNLAFKAMKSNGQATNITGIIYDPTGATIREIKSDYLGMGSFPFLSEKGKTYYLVCENEKGQTKRFDLPAAAERGYALSVNLIKDNIYISVQKPSDFEGNDELYLLAHTRGDVHFAERWDHNNDRVVIQKDQLPSGVLHLILFDTQRNPMSERLVFINNHDQTTVDYQPDRERFDTRSLVKNQVTVTDSDGEPVTGSFSVSVTSDREVTVDSTSNILTQLLLSSDLRGTIENPAYYFRNNSSSAFALDLLMLTQGWRRYNISELAKGQLSTPDIPIEKYVTINGTVMSLFQGKPAEGIEVTFLATNTTEGIFGNTKTDKDGRFSLNVGNFPDSSLFAISAEPVRGFTRMELFIDPDTSPDRTVAVAPPAEVDKYLFAGYADKAERKFMDEGGIRTYFLSEIVIVAPKAPRQSIYYSNANNSITRDELKDYSIPDLRTLLMRIPGILINPPNVVIWDDLNEGLIPLTPEEEELLTDGEKYEIQLKEKQIEEYRKSVEAESNTSGISIRGGGKPLLLIDDVIVEYETINDLDALVNPYDIDQIDILKDASTTAVFGVRGSFGAIAIFTKVGERTRYEPPRFNAKSFMPLGYQQPVEFYAPKYDTPEKRKETKYDLRTTIHWQPVVQIDDKGVASFEFYTADEPTSYSVIIEGLTNDGRIIRQEKVLWKNN